MKKRLYDEYLRRLLEVNDESKTDEEHRQIEARFRGWLEGVEDAAGYRFNGDYYYIELFNSGKMQERPLCRGVFLDWKSNNTGERPETRSEKDSMKKVETETGKMIAALRDGLHGLHVARMALVAESRALRLAGRKAEWEKVWARVEEITAQIEVTNRELAEHMLRWENETQRCGDAEARWTELIPCPTEAPVVASNELFGSGMILTVILRDDSPMIHYGDSPAYRSVRVDLTPEQVAAIAPRKTGTSGMQEEYESISKAFIEPNTKKGERK